MNNFDNFSTFLGNFSTFNDISFHTSPSPPLIRRHPPVLGFIKENNFFRLLHAWFSIVQCRALYWNAAQVLLVLMQSVMQRVSLAASVQITGSDDSQINDLDLFSLE